MDNVVGRDWGAIVARGIVAIIFGLAAIFWPGITIGVLIFLFGAFVLVNGAVHVYQAFATRTRNNNWIWELIAGIVGILVGIAVFVWPGVTALILLYFIAFWAIATGVLEIIAAFAGRAAGSSLLVAIIGVILLFFGLLLLAFPGAGALSLIFVIGAFALVYGVLLVFLGFSLRNAPASPTGS